MASILQASPATLQPVLQSLAVLQAALTTFGEANGFTNTSGQGTLSPYYVPYVQMTNLVNLLIANISSGQTSKQTQQRGGSLYSIAAQFYSDPTQAFALMSSNDLCTPWLPTYVVETINLPPYQSITASQGVSAAQVTP